MTGIVARAVTTAPIVRAGGRLLTAAVLLICVLAPSGAGAAGARLLWRHPGDLDRFKLFYAQPDDLEPLITELYIENPDVEDDGTFSVEVSGIDPLRPTFFLMVGVAPRGFLTAPSNVMELGTESFCEAFDVNNDGNVTTIDALAVARAAVGLRRSAPIDLEATIITALEILRVAAASACR